MIRSRQQLNVVEVVVAAAAGRYVIYKHVHPRYEASCTFGRGAIGEGRERRKSISKQLYILLRRSS